MSAITQIPFIPEGSQATPGLFNSRYQIANENFSSLGSGFFMSELSNVTIGGFIHATIGVGIGSLPSGSTQTTAALIIGVNSNHSDYFHLTDSSGQRSSYIIGSRVGGTADGLNIYDQSGQTMIVSFSKQSVRFFQQIVGPVFDTASDYVNAATLGSGSDSTESRINAAIVQAAQQSKTGVYLPRAFYPYSASSVSFIHTLQMVREGGSYSVYDVQAYGAHGNGARNDRSAFSACAAACPAGGTMLVSSTSSYYKIDNSTSGLSEAIFVDRRITVQIDGEVRSNSASLQTHPPAIFYVTADDVTFQGAGTLRGNGTIHDTNLGNDNTFPSLVRVTGDSFTMTGLTIDTPPKVGVHVVDAVNATIVGCTFIGGPSAYSDTAYFGIRASGGGRHTISQNHFSPDANGGMYVSCIFFSAVSYSLIDGNIAFRPYEKLAYLNGDFNVLTGNIVSGSTTTIPGTNQTGTVGPALRMDGVFNKCTNNVATNGGGFQSIGGGKETNIAGNTFLSCGQAGISVTGGTFPYDNLTIKGNTISCGNLAGVPVNDGILLELPSSISTSRGIQINDNLVTGFSKTDPIVNVATWQANTAYPKFAIVKPTVANSRYYQIDSTYSNGGVSGSGEPTWETTVPSVTTDNQVRWSCNAYETAACAQIRVIAQSALSAADRTMIANNSLSSGARGISTSFMHNSSVFHNQIQAATWGIVETSGSTNRYAMNLMPGASNAGIQNLAANSAFDGSVDWTPAIGDGTNTATMAGAGANAGTYRRLGDRVRVTGQVFTTALAGTPGTVSGDIRITGLPIVAASGIKNRATISVGFASGLNITAGQAVTGWIDGGTNYVNLYLWDSAAGATAMQATEWSDDGGIMFEVEYNTAP